MPAFLTGVNTAAKEKVLVVQNGSVDSGALLNSTQARLVESDRHHAVVAVGPSVWYGALELETDTLLDLFADHFELGARYPRLCG